MTERPSLLKGPFPGTLPGAYCSQHCINGRHEGVELPEGWPPCKAAGLCKCSCHTLLRDLQPGDPWMLEPVEGASTRVSLQEELRNWMRENGKTPKADHAVQAVLERQPGQLSSSGRRAPGALELQVLDVAAQFADRKLQVDDGLLSCTVISAQIAKQYNCPNPSLGAVQAVLDRWEAMEFAYCRHRPNAFLAFSGPYTQEALAQAKARFAEQKKVKR